MTPLDKTKNLKLLYQVSIWSQKRKKVHKIIAPNGLSPVSLSQHIIHTIHSNLFTSLFLTILLTFALSLFSIFGIVRQKGPQLFDNIIPLLDFADQLRLNLF